MRVLTLVSRGLGVVVCLLAVGAAAQPLYFNDTRHYYERVDEGLSWNDAKLAAESRSYLGTAGHLATITFQAEYDFVHANLHDNTRMWLGGYQPQGSPEPDQAWTWVTGEPWDFTLWAEGEPNDSGNEDCLEIFPPSHKLGLWNDYRGDQAEPYLVEYPVPPMPGDTDGNRVVDGLDLTAVLTAWDSVPGHPRWNPGADLDDTDYVDGLDLTSVLSNWTTAPVAGTLISEPGTLLLVGLGALGLLLRRRG